MNPSGWDLYVPTEEEREAARGSLQEADLIGSLAIAAFVNADGVYTIGHSYYGDAWIVSPDLVSPSSFTQVSLSQAGNNTWAVAINGAGKVYYANWAGGNDRPQWTLSADFGVVGYTVTNLALSEGFGVVLMMDAIGTAVYSSYTGNAGQDWSTPGMIEIGSVAPVSNPRTFLALARTNAIATFNGIVYMSSDLVGWPFVELTLPEGANITGLDMSDEVAVIAASGVGGAVTYTSVDGGANWIQGLWLDAGYTLSAVRVSGTIGIAVGGVEFTPGDGGGAGNVDVDLQKSKTSKFIGTVYYTEDSGTTWSPSTITGNNSTVHTRCSLSGKNGLCVNRNFDLFYSKPSPVVCYVKGTLILTKNGWKPIEEIKEGTKVLTKGKIQKLKHVDIYAETQFMPVLWASKFKVTASNGKSYPICIKKDALGENIPFKDLYVSPNHGLLINGKRVVAKKLINETTIYQDKTWKDVEYYHLECDKHCAIFANGALSESYLNEKNRFVFENKIAPQRTLALKKAT
jgi:hypothetical protein